MKKEQIRNELFKIEVLRQRLMRPQFIALGLTVGQGQPRILKELLFEGSMTQKKLADACLLDVTTMSRTLDRMEQAGLLVRESNPDCPPFMADCPDRQGNGHSKKGTADI